MVCSFQFLYMIIIMKYELLIRCLCDFEDLIKFKSTPGSKSHSMEVFVTIIVGS